jgi:phosphatidylserine decarboxylase
MMWMMHILPKKWLSYWVGKLVHIQWPKPIATLAIQSFGKFYNIDFDEAEKQISEYNSIGDFFVRRLKPGVRPVADSPVVHPADSVISQIGEIQSGKCIQAKGKTYSVGELVGNFELAQKFQDGLFVTYYLCPTDYHRVHSPVDGVVKRTIHIPGHLWPVNSWSTENIENLFAVNERVVLEIESRIGNCLLVFVGATNVGQIRLSFDQEIATNTKLSVKLFGPLRSQMREKVYNPPVPISRGMELGAFHMGSTVVMIYPKNIRMQRDDWGSFQNKKVKLGEAFL